MRLATLGDCNGPFRFVSGESMLLGSRRRTREMYDPDGQARGAPGLRAVIARYPSGDPQVFAKRPTR
jgi:hypothetical protein